MFRLFWIFMIFTFIFSVPVYAQKQLRRHNTRASTKLSEHIPTQDEVNFKQLLNEADIIVIGKVIAISDTPRYFLKESIDPEWKIATIELTTVQLRLPNKVSRVQVIFANGNAFGERWPKLVQDQESIFILRDLAGLAGEYLRNQPVEKGQYYIVIDPESVQDKLKLEQIKKLINQK